MSLDCVEGYCEEFGLDDDRITAFLDYLWNMPLEDWPGSLEFREEEGLPELVYAAMGYDYPDGYEQMLLHAGVNPIEFRQLLESCAEIVFWNLYGAADHKVTIDNAMRCFEIAGAYGIKPPDPAFFEDSRWCDHEGWGNDLTVVERDHWRSL